MKKKRKPAKKIRRRLNPPSKTFDEFVTEYKYLMRSFNELQSAINNNEIPMVFEAWKTAYVNPNLDYSKLRKINMVLESIRRSSDATISKIREFNSSIVSYAPYRP